MVPSLEGRCPHCGGQIEVPADSLAPVAECPRCGQEASIRVVVAARRGSTQATRTAWLILAALAVLLLGMLGWLYRRFALSGLDLVAEATGSRTTALAALALGFLVLVWVIVWMLFPIFVCLALRDLRRRTADLNHTTRLCAYHLAQLTADGAGSKPPPPPGDQPPGTQSP